jgi:hypothetical protein
MTWPKSGHVMARSEQRRGTWQAKVPFGPPGHIAVKDMASALIVNVSFSLPVTPVFPVT